MVGHVESRELLPSWKDGSSSGEIGRLWTNFPRRQVSPPRAVNKDKRDVGPPLSSRNESVNKEELESGLSVI